MLVPESGGAAAGNVGNDAVSGGGGSDSAGEVRGEEGDRNLAGNRWPREEVLVLLQVRQSMDEAFRDTGIKAPLWDEVSRKLADFGYHRSAKKCKEKFENIYKYHRRTKEGRSGRQDGKHYRYFEQLEIFDNLSSYPVHQDKQFMMEQTMSIPKPTNSSGLMVKPVSQVPHVDIGDPNFELMDTSTSTTSCSGRESERHVKKKRKLMVYFNGLMKQVLERQENLQKKFIEVIEKLEQDRMNREEEWRAQQLATKKREQEIIVRERSASAAKDAAVLAFLQKVADQSTPLQVPKISSPLEKILSMPQVNIPESSPSKTYVSHNFNVPSSRWPKAEVEALITVRENLDMHYTETGSRGSVWEEVSSAMNRLGYDRNPKRCKEKWENINKYYRRVKESNKKRRQDSKTCPYFDRLDSLYERRSKKFDISTSDSSGGNLKPEDILMQMIGHQRERVVQESGKRFYEESRDDYQSQEEEEEEEEEDEGEDDVRNDELDVEYQVMANNNP